VFPGVQGGPLMNTIAAKAVALREAMSDRFRRDQERTIVNARALADGLAAAGLRIVSGGTETHLFLVDLRSREVTGREAEGRLEKLGIALNKNTIPFDPEKPMVCSGVRLGTPAVTTRGMGPEEMRTIAALIDESLEPAPDARREAATLDRVRRLCHAFPLYPWLRRPSTEAAAASQAR
jgi:glycine hydroxymethyltransferase